MGTRSLTHIKQGDQTIMTMYRQFDGYLDGHGVDLVDFLKPFTIVNGMRGDDPEVIANGMGCLAAQLVKHFKSEPGNIYIYPPNSTDCGEEYVYTVSLKDDELQLKAVEPAWDSYAEKLLYDGPISAFDIKQIVVDED